MDGICEKAVENKTRSSLKLLINNFNQDYFLKAKRTIATTQRTIRDRAKEKDEEFLPTYHSRNTSKISRIVRHFSTP